MKRLLTGITLILIFAGIAGAGQINLEEIYPVHPTDDAVKLSTELNNFQLLNIKKDLQRLNLALNSTVTQINTGVGLTGGPITTTGTISIDTTVVTTTGTQTLSNKTMVQSAWTTMAGSYLNSWANFGGNYQVGGYFKDSMGIVHLRGFVSAGTAATSCFTLPSGYRPSKYEHFPVVTYNNTIGVVIVQSDGNIIMQSVNNTYASLNGITFDTR